MRLEKIAIALLIEPHQPVRVTIEIQGVEELAQSIRELGLIQPIVVRPEGEKFEVIAGHRRLLAVRMLGMDFCDCLVLEDGDTDQAAAARLHENLIRRDMSPVEEAAVYAELYEKLLDIDKVAAYAHRSRAVVERRLSLLEGDVQVRDALHAGSISAGVAEQLNKVVDEYTRHFLLRFAVQEGATVEKARGWRQSYAQNPIQTGAEPAQPEGPPPPAADAQDYNQCWLCGSSEFPHDLRVRMIHQMCEFQWRRSLEQRRERVEELVDNGQPADPADDPQRARG